MTVWWARGIVPLAMGESSTPRTDIGTKSRKERLAQLGPRVLELRNERGWNQKELAGRAGIHPTRLSRIERGVARPSLDELMGLADALGVRLDDLLGRDGPPPARPSRLLHEFETFASPEERAGMAALLQLLLAGYRAVTRQP